MSREPDYRVEDLTTIVRKWIRTIYELLKRPISNAETSLDAGEVGGMKLAEVRAEVNGEIDEHISAVYPHQPTLSDLFYTASLHQQNFLDHITVNWQQSIITVSTLKIQIMGKEFTVEGFSRPLLTGTNYLILKGVGSVSNRVFSLELATRPSCAFLEYTVAILYRSPNSIVSVPIYRMD